MSQITEQLEREGHYDSEGQNLERGLPIDQWFVPAVVHVDGENLVWTFRKDGPVQGHQVTSAPGLLEDFILLADATPAQVLGYARKWGVLHVCKAHQLPASHDTGASHHHLKEKSAWFCQCELDWVLRDGVIWYREPFHVWQRLSQEARILLRLSAALNSGEVGAKEDWTTLSRDPDSGYWLDDNEMTRESQLFDGKSAISQKLSEWLSMGDVKIVPYWGSGPASIRFGSRRLFGALAIQLMAVAMQTKSFLFCSYCNVMYEPKRRPRSGDRNYCPSCREKGIPQSANALRWYHNKRKAKRQVNQSKEMGV